MEFVRSEVGSHPCEYELYVPDEKVYDLLLLPIDELIRHGVELDGASRWLTKKSYFVDRQTELICHILRCSPERVEQATKSLPGDRRQLAANIVSYAVGAAFGRWRLTVVDNSSIEKFVTNPFEELPKYQPAAQQGCHGVSILVEDQGHELSIVDAIDRALRSIWPTNNINVEAEITGALGVDLNRYIQKEFFSNHIATYTKSRRTAPIYWPLATNSGNYTIWVYYHKLTSQTLYTVINDLIEPKLKQIGYEATSLRDKEKTQSREDESGLEKLESLEIELTELRDILLKLAKDYRPNLNDGVEICAAPLWHLFRHKPWQKALKIPGQNSKKATTTGRILP